MNMDLQGRVAKDVCRPNAGIDISKHHVDVCCDGQMHRLVREKYGTDPTVTYFESPVVVGNVTQQILTDE